MGRLKVEASLAEGRRRQIHRRCTTESIAGSAAGFTAEFAVHSLAVLWLGLCLLAHLIFVPLDIEVPDIGGARKY